ncbi:hypothetical protein [Chryseobacterium indologenes]|uniref:hypothetical protein n=1 Tax=Chryseobacterium indologenes TaxID=253 RepID=UPI000A792F3C|nr:hypothetical protein [Chryseobacterium indologenes]
MKKLLFTTLLGSGLLLPASFTAAPQKTKSEISNKKPKKKTSKSKKNSNSRSFTSYASNRGCTYNGNQLYVGKRGGCYYYTGNSKQYVDRSYCSGCN